MASNKLIIDPERGTATRIFVNGNIRNDVGATNTKGYKQVSVNGSLKLLHVLIWEMRFGTIPEGMQIDHINGVKSDNRIENLRLVTPRQNQENRRKPRAGNSSGIKGVWFDKLVGKWRASITYDGNTKILGWFVDKYEAAKSYGIAAATYHTHNPLAAKE